MPGENATATAEGLPETHAGTNEDAPLAIRVEDVHKAFRIPTHRVDSLKERAVHPFSRPNHRELRALDGVSFDIHQGEFFGIVGRNGSGKSTLLKLLASIYRPDAGSIQMAGRLAPFIELGVGFNPELSARENVVLNGVMMGLTPQETRARLDDIVAFAELEEFVDLKLKNYSSGMLVRLAFALMLEVDADILLIDEVLAVGDANFQQKCADAFFEMKMEGKTIILVTHDMSTVEEYCHRAMLIDGGHVQYIGDPGEVGRRYTRLNFERGSDMAGGPTSDGDQVRLLDAWIENESGQRIDNIEHGRQIRLRVELEALSESPGIGVGFILANAEGIGVFQFGTEAIATAEGTSKLTPGRRVRVEVEIENLLSDGRYFVHCGVNRVDGGVALYVHNAVDFVVFGGDPHSRGLVTLPHRIGGSVEAEGAAS